MPEEVVGFVQVVSEDLKRLRELIDKLDKDISFLRQEHERKIDDLRKAIYDLQVIKVQALEIEMATIKAGAMLANKEAIDRMVSSQMWLSRLLIGGLLTGILGGFIAFVFQLLKG